MTPDDLDRIKQLIDRVIYSPNKSAAQPYVKKLDFSASRAKANLAPYFAGKLGEAVGYAKEASGRTRSKEHWISCMERSWYVLENHVKHDSSHGLG